MKQIKLIFWLLILGFMALVFFQNKEFFLAKNSLQIDLWFEKYTIQEIANGLYFLGCFLVGLLLAYFYQMPERFRSGKNIKQLNAEVASLKAEAAGHGQNKATAATQPSPQAESPTAPNAPAEPAGNISNNDETDRFPKEN